MKTRSKLLTAIAIVSALIVGFLIGISVDYPNINNSDVSGTIGKVNNYRNSKASEAAIELKNELVADTALLKLVKNYMQFNYTQAIKMSENIDFALVELNKDENFKSQNEAQIGSLESFGKFLKNSRPALLAGVSVCIAGEQCDPAVMRESLAMANNIIVQINYRNQAVLNMIDQLGQYIDAKGPKNVPGIVKAYDEMSYTALQSSVVLGDKVVSKFFNNKKLYLSNVRDPLPVDYKSCIEMDAAKLTGSASIHNSENLSHKCWDATSLGAKDAQSLGDIVYTDATSLGVFNSAADLMGFVVADKTSLGKNTTLENAENVGNAEKVGSSDKLGMQAIVWDADKIDMKTALGQAEAMGVTYADASALGSFNATSLGMVAQAASLGFRSSENLNVHLNAESLGSRFLSSQSLGNALNDMIGSY